MILHHKERKAELLVLLSVMIYGAFPVIINYATGILPPIFFAGVSTLVASMALLAYIFFTRVPSQLLHKKAFLYSLGVAIFIIVIPSLFIYTGTSLTSGINTVILLQSEIVFTFFFCWLFFKEEISLYKILAALFISLGAIVILYDGKLSINTGELLIILGTLFFPVGNRFAKKALELVEPQIVLFFRSFFGGSVLLLISFFFEDHTTLLQTFNQEHITMILLNGVIIFAVSKVIWYHGLKHLQIHKAISLGMCFPAFSLALAALFLGEIPDGYQMAGFVFTMLGLYLMTRKQHRPEILPENI